MFTDIHHPGYLVASLEEAISFYEHTFGGTCESQGTSADGGRNAFIKVGEAFIEIVEPVDKGRLAGRGRQVIDHIGYVVPDIDKAVAELKAKGIRFAEAQPRTNIMGWRLIYLDTADTMGARIHLTQV
ncbi:MAG: VOC family protein [Chloroflexi bacterium]|nr:VOC family protein [Chloroflexota bacterium]